ncbi:serine hydrolase [Chitinophaga japonensis]|uniref:CubicO group peptidase (Beta-lactamase class C family) n=1 Tax=Chitinophaga japonensis TaxID=104662 RepID=A0A562T2T8_CHIJA|nr:serine hydrolase [Chitinophaga japonensis]TWI87939.1 CubicO group peptidase (beta-lactamase class C family) [Chitinophaga japonensis]
MRGYFTVLLVLAGMLCRLFCYGQHQLHDTIAARLQSAVAAFKDKHHAPGVVVGIVHDHEMIFSEALGYTDLEHKTPVTVDSKFPVMSVTKTFTATMLMQLTERGVVRLDDDVRKYVPEYKVRSDFPETAPTTLFQLATHTAGLPRNTPADYNFTVSWDRWALGERNDPFGWFSTDEELLRSLQFIKLEYPPYDYIHHNDRHYSNLGYSILGIALQRAAKAGYREYIREHVFNPLGMKNSGFLDNTGNDPVARGYRYNDAMKTMDRVPAFRPYAALYAGGIYSTTGDMLKYISGQFENDGDTAEVLTPQSNAMMRYLKIGWKPAFPYVLHEGAIPGYRCVVVFNPRSRVGWVILTNAGDVDFNEINGQLAGIVNPLYEHHPSPRDIRKYVGTYRLPGGYGSLKIFLEQDQLYSTYLLPDSPLVAEGADRFKAEGRNGYSIHYEFVAEGTAITALKLGQFVWYREE